MAKPDPERGAWLRRGREQRGWGTTEMARRLIDAGRDSGDNTISGMRTMLRNVQRWEEGRSITPRYRLLYCRAFGIRPAQFGEPGAESPDPDPAPETAAPALPAIPPESPMPDPAHLHLPPTAIVTYRGRQDSVWGKFAVGQEVAMAAHESSNDIAEHGQHSVGEITLEQLRADLVRLSRLTDTDFPLPAFLDLRRVRDRIYMLLDRRLRPSEQADLYFLLGCVNGLMGHNARRLGYPDAAEELLRAGYAYADVIDHNPLRGLLRVHLSAVMYWRGRFRESRDHAADGLRYVTRGPLGGNLHLNHARALARLGEHDAARQAVGLARDAREGDYRDDLTEIGGEEFALSRPTSHAMAGGALADTGDDERDAAAELEQAISLYDEAQAQGGGEHWFGGKALAGTDLALVRLRSGGLDAAAAALEPVLALPSSQRVSSLATRLARVRDELAAPVFQRSPQARDLGEQIETFDREAVASGLRSLTG